jgi:hypothetical protein
MNTKTWQVKIVDASTRAGALGPSPNGAAETPRMPRKPPKDDRGAAPRR